MVNSKLRRHKVMEKVIKKLMANNLPPSFKFKDTYESIELPGGYTLPSQVAIENEFTAMLLEEDALPTVTMDIEDLDIISTNVYSNTTTGRIGIGTANPAGTLHVHSTDSIVVPSGTTAQRSQTPVNGMLRYNSETGYFETYTVSGWGSLATPPSIESFTPTVVDTSTSSGTQITVTGSFFDQNSSIKLRGSDGTEYSTTSFSFTSTTSISATLPFLPSTNSPYTVVVTAGSGLSTESTDTLTANNNTPVWSSPAAGATEGVYTTGSTTITLSVTDADGDTLTYSIVSGTLPSGLTLSGNTISGTSTASVGSTSTITVRASDGELYADRTFTIETKGLYAFTSHTFTNAGRTGRTGPTLTELRNAYSVTWDGDTSLFNVSGGIQYWTVPESANYTFVLGGSQGGFPYTGESPGYGALLSGTIYLQKGTILKILVGQSPIQATVGTNQGGAGGGGTFVTLSDNTPLFVAGGGAGNPRSTIAISKLHGISTSGDPYYVSSGRTSASGGGGSFYSNSTNTNWGKSFTNGGEGGTHSTDGGFGGGGGSYYTNSYGAGGGGYSGGDEVQTNGNPYAGSTQGGGTSYVISTATSVTRTTGGNTTTLTGFVTITKI